MSPRLKFYSAWFCPFAQRATLALEYHGLEYEWVEALGWESRPASGKEAFDAASRSEWIYHWKHPDLLAANPEGMVPTLVSGTNVATESIAVVELIDLLAKQGGSALSLMPSDDPWAAAKQRVWAQKANAICSEYYAILVRKEDAAFERLCAGLRRFSAHLGPFFDGREEPGLVDLVLLPYAVRFYVLEHYRNLEVPRIREYDEWLERMLALPRLAATVPDKDKYLRHVEKYASGKARSKVANAVRRGVPAHDYDDRDDDDNDDA